MSFLSQSLTLQATAAGEKPSSGKDTLRPGQNINAPVESAISDNRLPVIRMIIKGRAGTQARRNSQQCHAVCHIGIPAKLRETA
jgi:hypothetical protein